MGCCVARPVQDLPAGNNPNSSSRAINSAHAQSQSALPTRPSTHTSNHSHAQSRPALADHPNKPLKPHVWTSRDRLWTRAELDKERTEFFDTRVTGQPFAWQAIRQALEILWEGGDAMDEDGGLGTAQQILNAAGISLTSGDLAGHVYDDKGERYPLLEHIVSDPTNMITEAVGEGAKVNDEGDGSGDSEELDEDELSRRREEKGKAVVNPDDMIQVTARRSDGGHDLRVSISKNDPVRVLKRLLAEESDLEPTKTFRLFYMGKALDDKLSLLAQGWNEGQLISACMESPTEGSMTGQVLSDEATESQREIDRLLSTFLPESEPTSLDSNSTL